MKIRGYYGPVSLFLILSLAALSIPLRGRAASSAPDARLSNGIHLERPPLRFEINEGQTDPQVRFTARGSDGISFLTTDGVTFQLSEPLAKSSSQSGRRTGAPAFEEQKIKSSFVRLKTVGANPGSRVIGLQRLPGVTNYFIGNDQRKWRTNVAGYSKVRYEGVYPGIDLVYYDNGDGGLEYDFIVAPGADPGRIALSIEGARSVEIAPSGDLVINAATGQIHQPAPRIYQEINGQRRAIAGRYKRIAEKGAGKATVRNEVVAFAIAAYDRTRPLVIDPEVLYATYLGGSSVSTIANEGARGVAVDAQGSVYVVGTTQSANFPTKNPAQGALQGFTNAFITKLDASGQMVYSTFLGGNGFDDGAAIKVDGSGAAYIGGTTSSNDFPTVSPLQRDKGGNADAFVAKLSPSGSQIVYATYLGGRDNEFVTDIAVGGLKNLFVVGTVVPVIGGPFNDFPTVLPIQKTHGGGSRDGFFSVINPTGSGLRYSTYVGGDGDDYFQSIVLDPPNKRALLGFSTDSTNFASGNPTLAQKNMPFVTNALAPTPTSGTITIGGGVDEEFIDPATGDVEERDITLEYHVIGGVPFHFDPRSPDKLVDMAYGYTPALFSMYLASSDFDTSSNRLGFAAAPAERALSGGGLDVRVHVLDQTLNLKRTLFFGGSGEDTVNAIAADSQGAPYVIGRTRSADLPTVNPIQAAKSGGDAFDGFLAVFDPVTLDPVFATYLGGIGMESLTGVTVDPQGNIYVVGETFGNFPNPTSGAIQNQLRGRTDAFIIKISPAIAGVPSNPGISPFSIPDRGGVSLTTPGNPGPLTAGYARIQPDAGSTTPSGMAIFGYRTGGVLVSEAAVPASALLKSGRIYAEVNEPVNTGIAIANPNNQAATITFNFTNSTGQTFNSGTTILAANGQIAAFLNDAPFFGGNSVSGTFSFSSDVPVSVVALRGFTNERSEFLMTTLPVVDLAATVAVAQTIILPHFAEGAGWTTQVVLVNPTDSVLNGNVQFLTQGGAAAALTVDGQSNSSFPYTIAARSSRRLQSSGLGALQAGSIRIVPSAGNSTPSGAVIFTYKGGGTTVAEAGVPALPTGTQFRLYAEASGNFNASQIGSIQTGLAIANSSPAAASVTFELTRLDGSSTGLTGSINVSGNGQTSLFMGQIPGFSSLGNPAAPFQGVLRITSGSTAIAVVGLRGRYNERRDFLITTTAPVNESAPPSTNELFFPHLADSGGFTTQFVLFSGSAGQASTGTLRFFSQLGVPLNLSLR